MGWRIARHQRRPGFLPLLFVALSFVTRTTQPGELRFLPGFADGAMMPAVRRHKHWPDLRLSPPLLCFLSTAGGGGVGGGRFSPGLLSTALVVRVNVMRLTSFYRRPVTARPAGESSAQPASAAGSAKIQD